MIKLLKYSFIAALFSGLVIFISSCNEDENLPPATPPVIAILSISPDTVVQFQDSVIIEIQYEDQNGDLGSPDPDQLDLEIKDSRLNSADAYHVKPLAPPGTNLFIRGVLSVELPPLFLLGNGSEETVSFNIRLRDQNGAWSELLTSDPITVVRQ